jgi:hypothetical protein
MVNDMLVSVSAWQATLPGIARWSSAAEATGEDREQVLDQILR